MTPTDALLRYPLFALLCPAALDAWAAAGEERAVALGETLLQAGTPGRHAYPCGLQLRFGQALKAHGSRKPGASLRSRCASSRPSRQPHLFWRDTSAAAAQERR